VDGLGVHLHDLDILEYPAARGADGSPEIFNSTSIILLLAELLYSQAPLRIGLSRQRREEDA
jgi:hypothetical protein